MTPNVVEKTAITLKKNRRRHQDPSWLWIALFTASMVLHLLAFLLVRSTNEYKPWFPQTDQDAISVDLIELDPQATTIAKTSPQTPAQKSPAPRTATQNPNSNQLNTDVSLVETKKNTPVTSNRPTPNLSTESQPTPQATEEPTTKPKTTPQATTEEPTTKPKTTSQATEEPTTEPKPTSRPKLPPGNLPGQGNRQEVQLGEGKKLPSELPENLRDTTTDSSPTTSPTSSPDPNQDSPQQNQPNLGENNTASNQEKPTQDNNSSPDENSTASNQEKPTQDNSQPQASGGLIARWQFLTPQEQRIKMQKYPPDKDLILPQYTGSKVPDISITDNGNQDLPPGKFLVSLVINQSGNLVDAEFVGSNLPPENKQKVVNLTKEIFQGESFTPHHFPDNRTPPELSNLFVWITIQPKNSQ